MTAPVRSKTNSSLQLALWIGLLCVEIAFVFAFFIVPQFQARNAPQGHWEMERPDGPWLSVAAIVWLGAFIMGNVGLIVIIRRRFKELKSVP
jgi:hypothetical protein